MSVPTGQDQARRAATEEEAKAMASPLRLRILRLCLHAALTNKEIADLLGRDPASVLYHVRRLVRTGFLVPEKERRGNRGAREVPYRATGKSWTLHVVEPGARRQENVAMIQTLQEEMDDVADADDVWWCRIGLRLSPAERLEFSQRLGALVEEFRQRETGTEAWAAFLTLYPERRPVRDAAKTQEPIRLDHDTIGGR